MSSNDPNNIQEELQRLRAENEQQRIELEKLNNRVEKVEDTSRKLAEKSGVVSENGAFPGSGGPALPLDEMGLATLMAKMSRLEEDMRAYEAVDRIDWPEGFCRRDIGWRAL